MTEITKESTGMNPKIKERIEQIRQGIVPEGYKKTRIGIIPEEWEVKALSDVCHVTMGQSPKSEFYNDEKEGLPLIQGNADIKNGKTFPKIYTTDITKRCFPNDIILSVRAPVGEVSWSVHEACIGRGVCSISTREGYDNKFLFYYLLDNEVKWEKYSQGSTFKAVNSRDIRAFPVLNIPLLEQQQIAEILSTWDRAIELKEALIKEKEEQKKGKLEYFFSKDFNECYTEEKFDNVFYRIPNGKYRINKKDYLEKGEFPVVDQSKSYIAGYTNQKEKLFEINNNPVIIFGDHTRVFKFVDFDFVVGADGTNILSTKKEYDIKYFYYAISSKRIPDTGYNRHYKFLQEMTFYVPPIKLQKKVSKILSYLDYNINLLKQELALLKEQKKGLMQLLLTGIVRVGEVEELE